MQKKKSTTLTFNFVDTLISLICILGMFIAIWLFQKDMNISLTKLGEEPIAVIYFKYNTAQRRLIDRNLWERLRQASPVYNGDRIRTSVLSEAVTVFTDGTRVELHENTLIQVFRQKKNNSIDFINGSISAITGSDASLDVVVAGKTVSFESDTEALLSHPMQNTENVMNIELNEKSIEPVSIIVSKGDVSVRDFLQTDIPQIQYLDTSSFKNLMKDLLTSYDILNLSKGKITDKNVTIAKYNSLDSMNNFLVEENQKDKIIQLTSGEKAVFIPENMIDTFPRSFFDTDVRVLSPSSSVTLLLKNQKVQNLSFLWNSTEDIIIEFATDRNFADIVYKERYSKNQDSTVISLAFVKKECTLFWRTYLARNESINNESSSNGTVFVRYSPEETVKNEIIVNDIIQNQTEEIVLNEETTKQEKPVETEKTKVENTKVEIKKEEPVKILTETIKIKSPENNIIFNDVYFENNSTISFEWESLKEASSYIFTVYLASDKNKPLFSRETTKTKYSFTDEDMSFLDEGLFEWTVYALDKKKNESKKSSSVFSIDLSSLENIEIDTEGMINNR